MFRITTILILVGLVIPASSHLIYVEFPEQLNKGSEAPIFIAYGHGEPADPQQFYLSAANLISPNGDKTVLELEPYKGGFKGKVALKTPGCYLIDLQTSSSFFDPSWLGAAGSKTLLEKYCRAILPVESGEGFGWLKGNGLEIIPEVNPYNMKSGDRFRARALWNGNPVKGSYIAAVIRSPEEVLRIQHAMKTDVEGSTSDGEIDFSLTQPGLWVLTFEATLNEPGIWIAENDDHNHRYKKGDKLRYEQIAATAYLNFWVVQ